MAATPLSYAVALVVAPLAVGAFGMLLELCMMAPTWEFDRTSAWTPSCPHS